MYYYDDFLEALEEIYKPLDVVYISDMDNSLSCEYLIALDNKGFLSEDVDLSDGITMQTMDFDIKVRDLHYLYVKIATEEPYLMRSIWRYLKGSEDLVVYEEARSAIEIEAYEKLKEFIDRFDYKIF